MSVNQWEIWKGRPPGFEKDHWFVIVSGQERCSSPVVREVNGLACFTLRGPLPSTDVKLNSADGFSTVTSCQCDFLYTLSKSKVHSSQGFVSWERQQQIKSKLREVLRLL